MNAESNSTDAVVTGFGMVTRIGRPASWYGATAAASESGGAIEAVTDDEILAAYRYLAQQESVFCEPASAASVAGLIKKGVPAVQIFTGAHGDSKRTNTIQHGFGVIGDERAA